MLLSPQTRFHGLVLLTLGAACITVGFSSCFIEGLIAEQNVQGTKGSSRLLFDRQQCMSRVLHLCLCLEVTRGAMADILPWMVAPYTGTLTHFSDSRQWPSNRERRRFFKSRLTHLLSVEEATNRPLFFAMEMLDKVGLFREIARKEEGAAWCLLFLARLVQTMLACVQNICAFPSFSTTTFPSPLPRLHISTPSHIQPQLSLKIPRPSLV